MAARSGKKETKTTTTRVKKVVAKVTPPAAPSPKKSKKKAVSEDLHVSVASPKKNQEKKLASGNRHASLKQILLVKREALIQQIKQQLGQSVSEEQQRRLEAAMDSGDQALVDLERENGDLSSRNAKTVSGNSLDDALDSLDEGTYGMCADCGEEISEKRLHALPFARLCVECQSKRELMEKIERSETALMTANDHSSFNTCFSDHFLANHFLDSEVSPFPYSSFAINDLNFSSRERFFLI